jgi:methylated-DNA-[protein]-cysteine S-methyltransferase
LEYDLIAVDWGTFAYVAESDRLIATFLPQDRRAAIGVIRSRFPTARQASGVLPAFCEEVLGYFSGEPVRFRTPIDVSRFTSFRQAVLRACARIPYGKTASYGDLARAAGNPAAVRAAGGTMAVNPLPLVVPCHRVLRSDGSLGGFSSPAGVREKLRLLRHEHIDVRALLEARRSREGPSMLGHTHLRERREAVAATP